ncbi:vegetative cell wall protein gp1-like [Balaenoptera musculus]|uniref:Vegetative cell wall protein gp1-like n=1 Tax=Balaenoptera musculus TaxID=9771 RepID=A0A8B8XNT7_BALMU|nr:vegetative cell wall protein gp1-like [Balaenoptera musculus]
MAATSPRGSGGGGYSSQGSGCHRAALLRAPDSSAMFRQTSPGPARRLLAALPAIRSGSSPGPRSPAGPGGRAAVRAPPGAAPAPPAGRALRPPRPPPRPDPRAPGLSRRPAPDSVLSPAGAGSASRTSREQFPSTDWELSLTPREPEAGLQGRHDLLWPPFIAFKAGTFVFW